MRAVVDIADVAADVGDSVVVGYIAIVIDVAVEINTYMCGFVVGCVVGFDNGDGGCAAGIRVDCGTVLFVGFLLSVVMSVVWLWC